MRSNVDHTCVLRCWAVVFHVSLRPSKVLSLFLNLVRLKTKLQSDGRKHGFRSNSDYYYYFIINNRIILYTHPCVKCNRFIIYTQRCANATNIVYTQHFLLKIRNSKISSFCYAHKRPSPFFLYIPTKKNPLFNDKV